MPSNGQLPQQDAFQREPRREPAISIAIKNFSPIWFLISMDTGIISIIMNLLPWQFDGLGILATIMFIFNLVLFTLFSIMSLIRLFKFPIHVKGQTINQLEEISYLAAPAIAFLTLVAQVTLTCSTAWGYGLTVLAYVLWWIGLALTLGICSGSVIILSKRNITNDRELSPAIFLPIIGVLTLGTTGGIITRYSVGLTARMAVPVIVVSYIAIGYASFLAFLYYAIYMHRLLAVGPPMKAKLPSLVITVGPLGQFATAIQVISNAANTRGMFASYARGTWLQNSAASVVSAASELIALLAVGSAFLWITVSWYLIVEALVKRKLSFSMTWWSLIFPMGVFTTALLNLSIALDSDAFRGLTVALLIFMLIIYFLNLGFTFYRMFTGVAFMVPEQREEEEQQWKEARGKKRDENQ